MPPVYQMHQPGQKAMSDSFRKLERLHIPKDLTGARFLDVGCNEGFFCNVALERGAERVVGIDFFKPSLDTAREIYPDPKIEFRLQRWDALPDEKFDIILWASSMHYERDPARILLNMYDRLTPSGMVILECGVEPGLTREMVRVNRHSDAQWYPTEEFLTEELLRPFAARRVAWPETTEGDPIPRSVYHCQRRLPVVMLMRGQSHQGKSVITQNLKASATKLILLDLFLYRIRVSKFHATALDQYVRDNYAADNLTALYEGIDAAGLTDEFAACLAEGVAPSDRTVLMDGAMTDAQGEALAKALRGKAIIWDAARR